MSLGLDDDDDVETVPKSANIDVDEDDDGDDLEMIKVLDNHDNTTCFNSNETRSFASTSHHNTVRSVAGEYDEANIDQLTVGLNEDEMLSTQYYDTTGFDSNAGAVWIYPNNKPIRSYQFTIVEQCLHKNTMVVLPTGLGKTFIAVSCYIYFYFFLYNIIILKCYTKN